MSTNRATQLLAIALVGVFALILAACSSSGELTADAGPDSSVAVGESPSFDACASEGDIENYAWTIIDPAPAMPEDAGKVIRSAEASCSFRLDAEMGLDEIGEWVIELTVMGNEGAVATDRVTVTVTP
ncbi:MAG: hypothetical protein AAF567_06200 [Actinomycetota bacterium]